MAEPTPAQGESDPTVPNSQSPNVEFLIKTAIDEVIEIQKRNSTQEQTIQRVLKRLGKFRGEEFQIYDPAGDECDRDTCADVINRLVIKARNA